MPHPHDHRLEKAWQSCRWGFGRVSRDPRALAQVESWVEKFHDLAPGWLRVWKDILGGGYPERRRQLLEVESYFDLSEEDRGFWRPVVQSHPFAALLTRENLRE